MPKKILKVTDIKPSPMLWHEDNVDRRQQVRERAQVPGAMAGPQLGEAAHRLVKNTLNIKLNNTSHEFLERPPSHHTINNIRSAGPSGYGKPYGVVTNGYYGQTNHQGIMARPRYQVSSNDGHNYGDNFGMQDRLQQQEKFHNLKTGFSALTIEEGASTLRVSNSGLSTNPHHQSVQNKGSPIPTPKWMTKTPPVNGMHIRHQEATMGSAAAYGKPVKKVYQVKTLQPQDMPRDGNH